MNDDEKEINQTNHLPAAFGSFACLFIFSPFLDFGKYMG